MTESRKVWSFLFSWEPYFPGPRNDLGGAVGGGERGQAAHVLRVARQHRGEAVHGRGGGHCGRTKKNALEGETRIAGQSVWKATSSNKANLTFYMCNC